MLCARTQIKYGKNLGARVDGQPEYLSGAAQPGAQFVQLEVREPEMAEAVLVQGPYMFPCTRQPRRDGGLSIAEDSRSGRRIQSFGERREHHGDLTGRSFQTIQGGVASGSERHVASLAAKRLDALGLAMRAIPDQGVDMSICDPGVRAQLVGTGEALCV